VSLISYWYEDVQSNIIINTADPQTPPHRGRGLERGLCPLPRKIFQYCIIKWPLLVDSDVLHVLLIVVDRCYRYVGGFNDRF